jgi:putative ABC transport system permease protein
VKFLPLLWSNLTRKKVRTLFTLFAIAASFFVWGIVGALRVALSAGVDVAGADRLVVQHKVTIIMPLPESYGARIAQVPGVAAVAHASWFGGVYQDPKNFFPQLAVSPDYLDLYPEYVVAPEQEAAWRADRTGALIGRATAERFGFEVGDRVPIQGTFNVKRDGSRLWEFTVDGIYDAEEKGVDTSAMLFHYEYLDEARRGNRGNVGWYIVKVADPERAPEVVEAIDSRFANSTYETKTATEKAFAQAFADQVGNVGAIAVAVAGIVFFAMLLVAGNTMAQAVRERTRELAVLKTLGFRNRRVLGLVVAESLVLAGLGGGLGLGLAWLVIQGGDPTGGMLPVFYLPAREVAWALAFTLLLGLVTGLLPGWQAMRLTIVDALRRGG